MSSSSDEGLGPPAAVPAELLFASLVDVSPSAELRHRIPGAEDLLLTVRALPASDYLAARLASERAGLAGAPPELKRARYLRELLARCLYAGPAEQDRAFASADELGEALSRPELAELAGATFDVLQVINPTYARSDWKAWTSRLEQGARHPENASIAIALAGCADYGQGAVVFRPDRFWGQPIHQLLDGHWMAYRAARAAWVSDESGPRPGKVRMEVGSNGSLVPAG